MDVRYQEYIKRIRTFIPKDRVYTDELRRLAWGTDAGFYRYVPQVVVRSMDEAEVSHLLTIAHGMKLSVTFRAAGTSLSGQTVTDGIMIVAGQHWEGYSVSDDAATITLQPGLTGHRVDEILAPLGRMFSPDPASKNSAMVGGIVMNNASGMSCGTHANSDRILVSARLVLADGTVLDTGSEDSRQSFRKTHPEFVAAIEHLRDRVQGDEKLAARIRRKYAIKNVTGLNVYPLVMYDDPFDIIAHLLVGSEGTLAFGSEFTMRTAHLYPHAASAMLYFADMRRACEAVLAMKPGPVHCAELLDKKSLASVDDTTGPDLTAVLIQTFADSASELDANIARIKQLLAPFELYVPARFTSDPREYGKYWAIRSGIFPSVGGTRPLGTTVLIEDVAFHIEDLPDATVDLANMLSEHGYDDSCIYGHALEGNYHFILAQSFDTQREVHRYHYLMDEIVKLVVDKYDGSLKAEHGTGRNMAPFVRKEWGDEIYGIMCEVKRIFDPDGLLNPGVIFNDDPECFIKNVKPMPLTDDSVNKCIECGFCEVNCVSEGLGLSSRQRIIVQREIARLRATDENPGMLKRLERQYEYYGNQLCAADGLCSTSCPMKINVGDMTHHLRAQERPAGSWTHSLGCLAARHFKGTKRGVKSLLYLADAAHGVLGDGGVNAMGGVLHRLGTPLWTPSLPKPKTKILIPQARSVKRMVYFPSCLNQTMGRSRGVDRDLVDEVVAFLRKAGWDVIFPEGMERMCCGMIWESKGMPDVADEKTAQLEAALLKASDGGRYPVVCDQSPCLHRMRQHFKQVKPLELIEFVHDYVADDLQFATTEEPIALHLTCSTRLMGLADKVTALARRCSTHVLLPESVGCCGFAGDKGFTSPELNAYALRKLRPQIERAGVRRGFSNSRTCEIGLTTHSGVPYQSLIYLINELTTPKNTEQNVEKQQQ